MDIRQDKSATGLAGVGLLALTIAGLWWAFDRSEAARRVGGFICRRFVTCFSLSGVRAGGVIMGRTKPVPP